MSGVSNFYKKRFNTPSYHPSSAINVTNGAICNAARICTELKTVAASASLSTDPYNTPSSKFHINGNHYQYHYHAHPKSTCLRSTSHQWLSQWLHRLIWLSMHISHFEHFGASLQLWNPNRWIHSIRVTTNSDDSSDIILHPVHCSNSWNGIHNNPSHNLAAHHQSFLRKPIRCLSSREEPSIKILPCLGALHSNQ